MTCRELLAIEHPELVNHKYFAGCSGCPIDYNYADNPDYCKCGYDPEKCNNCWDREAYEEAIKKVLNSSDKNIINRIKQFIYEANGIPEEVLKNTTFAKACEYQNQKRMEEITESMFESDEKISLEKTVVYDVKGNAVAEFCEPTILDSGDRTEFPSGAVRDMRVGKGRCDLLPLDVVKGLMSNDRSRDIFEYIGRFQEEGDVRFLYAALIRFSENYTCLTNANRISHMLLEVAKHFEEGAKKYGDNNWQKGIPVNCYIDSAVRHYLKYLRGDQDEPHDRAFCWNILCCIWTVKHIEEAKENV